MLVVCPECQHEVSNKALSCVNCGYPLKRKQNSKKMRLPNGFGRITKLSNSKLRNPYRAMVTVGKDEHGKPIGKILKPKGYFKTYNEAYKALLEYNKNPYDLDDDITLEELYEKWSEKIFDSESNSTVEWIKSSWQYCSSVKEMRVKDIRVHHIKGVMENGTRPERRGPNKGQPIKATKIVQSRIKLLFSKMLDYAVEYDIVDKNYARLFSFSNKEILEENNEIDSECHIPFTEEELNILWSHIEDTEHADWVLIQCYMGWRPGEFMKLKLENIDLSRQVIIGGGKTKSGFRREVPIHHRILPLIEKNIALAKSANSESLIVGYPNRSKVLKPLNYEQYKYRFLQVIESLKLNPEHLPHDPRKTFATRLIKAGVDRYAVKKLLGHKVSDVTESVYVSRDIEWLRNEIEKVE